MTDRTSGDTVARVWRYPARDEHPDVDIFIYQDWCKCCGICSELCPAGVFTTGEAGRPVLQNPEACIACYLCEKLCPDMAITVYKERKKAGPSEDPGETRGGGNAKSAGGAEDGGR